MIMGGITDLNGSQKGKFHGMITRISRDKIDDCLLSKNFLTYLMLVLMASV